MHLFMCLVGNSCNGRNGGDQCFKMQRRKWNWLGHELRREGVNNCFMVLGWTPEDGGVGGRPKTTWGRTVKRDRGKAGWKSWNVAKMVACDREVGQTM